MKRSQAKSIEIRVRKILNSDFFGAYNSHFNGNWLDFRDLREYVPWDSVKRIDWKTSARNNEIFIKNFEEERDLSIVFFINVWESMQFGSRVKRKIDTLIEILYTLWLTAIQSWNRIWAYIYNGKQHIYHEAKKWEENIQKILNSIIDISQLDSKSPHDFFMEHLELLEKLKIKNSLICVGTDSLDLETSKLRWLNAKNQILVCNIFDRFENELWDESFMLSFWSWSFSCISPLNSTVKRRKYRDIRTQKQDTLSRSLRSSHIDYLEFDDLTNVYIHFLRYFQQWKI